MLNKKTLFSCRFKALTQLKTKNPDLRVMLSLGGWEQNPRLWSKLVSSRSNMVAFAEEAAQYLQLNDFDGLNLNWEYPATRGSPATDKQGYAELTEVRFGNRNKQGYDKL